MKVREEDNDWEDAQNFSPYGKATDPNDVAESYAEYIWRCRPCVPSYFDKNIEVIDDDGKIHKFNVTAKATVIFDAKELTNVAED